MLFLRGKTSMTSEATIRRKIERSRCGSGSAKRRAGRRKISPLFPWVWCKVYRQNPTLSPADGAWLVRICDESSSMQSKLATSGLEDCSRLRKLCMQACDAVPLAQFPSSLNDRGGNKRIQELCVTFVLTMVQRLDPSLQDF